MKVHGRASLSDFLGDLVVYRDLEPADPRLLGLRAAWREMGLTDYRIPRKNEPEYAAVILYLLNQARVLRPPRQPLQRLLYVGDTEMNDGTAIKNLASHLPTLGFICSEDLRKAKRVEVHDNIMVANRWAALVDFIGFIAKQGFALNGGMAAIIDLDKTAFGARGRNDRVIDAARVEAVRRTVQEGLGGNSQEGEFRAIYDELNRPQYHPFTADNQDYLTYICLMLAGGIYDYTTLLDDLAAGRLKSFEEFIDVCHRKLKGQEAGGLSEVHREVYANFKGGDPTPFKSFRYREYEATVARMDALPDGIDVRKLLSEEIVITQEVADLCRLLAGRGVLLFGLTDKPDEASIPRLELARRGYLPLHKVTMRVVGEHIYEGLREGL